MSTIDVQQLHKTYGRGSVKTEVLKGLSISFESGELVSILGRSGSGKTTFLNTMSTLEPFNRGEITIDDKNTAKLSKKKISIIRNQHIGFIFQSFNLLNDVTVQDNVALPLIIRGVPFKEARERALKSLESVGLDSYALLKPLEMSGGQQQRVAIARAIVNDQSILLCDEPTGALDDQTAADIMNLLRQMANTKCVIMVTHDEEYAKTYSDRIVILHDGKILKDIKKIKEKDTTNEFAVEPITVPYKGTPLSNIIKYSFVSMKINQSKLKKTVLAFSISIALFVLLNMVNYNFSTLSGNFFSMFFGKDDNNQSLIVEILNGILVENINPLIRVVAMVMLFFSMVSYLFVFIMNIFSQGKEVAVMRAFGASNKTIALLFTLRPIKFAAAIFKQSFIYILIAGLLVNGIFDLQYVLSAEYFLFFKNIFFVLFEFGKSLFLNIDASSSGILYPLNFSHFVYVYGIVLGLFMLGSLIPVLIISRKNTIKMLATE